MQGNSTVSLLSHSRHEFCCIVLNYARRIDLLLDHEPNNMQAQSLRTLIEQAVTRDGYIGELSSGHTVQAMCKNAKDRLTRPLGVGILAGAAAVTGIVLAGVWRRASRR
jgi:fission 1 protein